MIELQSAQLLEESTQCWISVQDWHEVAFEQDAQKEGQAEQVDPLT
jgi:hypothetical protein